MKLDTTTPLAESELIISNEGRIYHLNLKPDEIADTIITVGDPNRVALVSRHFDNIDIKMSKREIVTHTGTLNGQPITVISTGMGTGCIDIVINELDALANIDFTTRTRKAKTRSLDIIRIGTSGCLQNDIAIDSFVASRFAMGFDGLLNYYDFDNTAEESSITQAFLQQYPEQATHLRPVLFKSSDKLFSKFDGKCHAGITATCGGFYAPQGRFIRGKPRVENFLDILAKFNHHGARFTNFEMESAAIFGLGRILGHECLAVNCMIAHRGLKQFSKDMGKTVDNLIVFALENLCS